MAVNVVDRPQLYRVSWGALFAGFFFGLGAWLLLLALGAGIEFANFDPRNLGDVQGFSLGMGIWSVAAAMISLFFAGWMAARLSASEERLQGLLHGVALWGLVLIAGVWMATTAVARVATGTTGALGQAAEEAAQIYRLQGSELAPDDLLQGGPQANREQMAERAAANGATGALVFFVFGALTLAAAAIGGAAGVPRAHRPIVAREEPAPAVPDRPPSPQRA
jgi:hypothetical protein